MEPQTKSGLKKLLYTGLAHIVDFLEVLLDIAVETGAGGCREVAGMDGW